MNHCIVFFFTAFSTLLANPVPETSFDPLLFIPVKPSFDQTSPLDFLVQSQLSSNSVQPNPVGFFTQNEPDATSVQTYPVNPGQAGQVDSFQISTALDANQKAQVNPGDALSPDSYPEYDDSTDTYDKKEQKRKKTNLPSLPLLPVLEKVRNCPSGSASACCFGSGTKHTVQPDDALGILDALTTTYYDWLFGCVKRMLSPPKFESQLF